MNVLTLIATLLRTLAAADPGLGSGTSPLSAILDSVLITAAALIEAGEAGAGELQAFTAHVHAMVSSGTDPTEDDWNQLQARSDAAHAVIQAQRATPAAVPSAAPGQSTTTDVHPQNGRNST